MTGFEPCDLSSSTLPDPTHFLACEENGADQETDFGVSMAALRKEFENVLSINGLNHVSSILNPFHRPLSGQNHRSSNGDTSFIDELVTIDGSVCHIESSFGPFETLDLPPENIIDAYEDEPAADKPDIFAYLNDLISSNSRREEVWSRRKKELEELLWNIFVDTGNNGPIIVANACKVLNSEPALANEDDHTSRKRYLVKAHNWLHENGYALASSPVPLDSITFSF